jgi:hypothetical protein
MDARDADPAVEPQLDYDVLAEAYLDAIARIELLEEYAQRMLQLTAVRKLQP